MEYEKIELSTEVIHWQGPGYYASSFSEYHAKTVTYRMENGYLSQVNLQAINMGLGTPYWIGEKPSSTSN